ncbi:hypothetical protein C8R43DRAFT_1010852 [Mycena crocata]|nr:hypothetical protein C8R43DRAFT_1010852 [Mycena crocata]
MFSFVFLVVRGCSAHSAIECITYVHVLVFLSLPHGCSGSNHFLLHCTCISVSFSLPLLHFFSRSQATCVFALDGFADTTRFARLRRADAH